MFNFLRQPKRFIDVIRFLDLTNKRFINQLKPSSFSVFYTSENRLCCAVQNKGFLITNDPSRLILTRNKYIGKRKKHAREADESSDEEEEDDDDDDDDEEIDNVRTYRLNGARCDLILKAVLGISRKTVEEAFYQNKIRVNGIRLMKKSQNVKVGDEIDIIKNISPDSNSLNIGRVKIVGIKSDKETEKVLLKALKQKSLKVKNYSDENAYTESNEENHIFH